MDSDPDRRTRCNSGELGNRNSTPFQDVLGNVLQGSAPGHRETLVVELADPLDAGRQHTCPPAFRGSPIFDQPTSSLICKLYSDLTLTVTCPYLQSPLPDGSGCGCDPGYTRDPFITDPNDECKPCIAGRFKSFIGHDACLACSEHFVNRSV